MLKILPVDAVRRIEQFADEHGLGYAQMMQNAGRVVALRAQEILTRLPSHEERRVTVLVGGGNNGGDGLVAGNLLAQDDRVRVRFYLFKERADDDPVFAPVLQAGHYVVRAEDDHDHRVLRTLIYSAHMVIDAVYGIGFRLPMRAEQAALFRVIRKALLDDPLTPAYVQPALPALRPSGKPYVLAVDCPSGIDCDTGEADEAALPADETITFIAAKPGLIEFPAAEYVGELTVSTIDVPEQAPDLKSAGTSLVDAHAAAQGIPKRKLNSHKGVLGSVLIAGGSENYTGAVLLAGKAAYRAGTGIVRIATPALIVDRIAASIPEATWTPLHHTHGAPDEPAARSLSNDIHNYGAAVIGMGMGQSEPAESFLRSLLSLENLPPCVVDADALNLLAKLPEWWRLLPPGSVVTPHPGEMARLTGLSTAEVQRRRTQLARDCAAQWNLTVLLKGAHTRIAASDGYVNVLPFKSPELSVAGTGDVLAGMIGSLIAQGTPAFAAATSAAYLHALAGKIAVEQRQTVRGITAGDIADLIPGAFARLNL